MLYICERERESAPLYYTQKAKAAAACVLGGEALCAYAEPKDLVCTSPSGFSIKDCSFHMENAHRRRISFRALLNKCVCDQRKGFILAVVCTVCCTQVLLEWMYAYRNEIHICREEMSCLEVHIVED